MQCKIIHRYLTSVNALIAAEKKPRYYGTTHLLYHSEINLIESIYRNPDCNAIALARIMSITRGAVTQLANQLEEKGLIVKYLKSGNKKEKYYQLTALGGTARKGHEQYHREANATICNYLSTLAERDTALILDFLDQIAALPISEFECSCHGNCSAPDHEEMA